MRKSWIKPRLGQKNITQMHFAKEGILTEEMAYVARRENLSESLILEEVARGRLIIPANVNEQDIFITIMPDTYFDDFELGKKIIEKLDNNPELDAVLGLFKIRPEQLGKLGQCEINKDRVLSVVDKDPNCTFDYSWGVITWRGRYSKFIYDKDPHIGYSINPAIEDGAMIGYVVSDSEYYDCGTIDEYWEMVSTLI